MAKGGGGTDGTYTGGGLSSIPGVSAATAAASGLPISGNTSPMPGTQTTATPTAEDIRRDLLAKRLAALSQTDQAQAGKARQLLGRYAGGSSWGGGSGGQGNYGQGGGRTGGKLA
jgi:hypothetical protein